MPKWTSKAAGRLDLGHRGPLVTRLLVASLGFAAPAGAWFVLARRGRVMSGVSRIVLNNRRILSRWSLPAGESATHPSAPPEKTIPPGGGF
jgi:hypothetical protein